MAKESTGKKKMPKPAVVLAVPMHPELKDLIGKYAECADCAMNDWAVKVLAQAVNRPDLGIVPRKRFGRPRKVATAN